MDQDKNNDNIERTWHKNSVNSGSFSFSKMVGLFVLFVVFVSAFGDGKFDKDILFKNENITYEVKWIEIKKKEKYYNF